MSRSPLVKRLEAIEARLRPLAPSDVPPYFDICFCGLECPPGEADALVETGIHERLWLDSE